MKYIYITSIVASLLLGACGAKKSDSVSETPVVNEVTLTSEQAKNVDLNFCSIQKRKIKTEINLKGMLDVPPQNIVSITPPYGGYLKKNDLMEGVHVRKGQVLAVLEHPDYIQLQQDYLDVLAKLAYAEAELNRQKQLAKEQINSQKTIQQVNTEFDLLNNQRLALAQKLSLINIDVNKLSHDKKISKSVNLLSPIDGYVRAVNANIGKYIQPSDILFEIVNTSHMHIAIKAFEKDVQALRVNQKLTFTLPNNGMTQKRTGYIHLIGQTIDADKTVAIHAHFDKDSPTLLPGMYVDAHVKVESENIFALPKSAIAMLDGKFFVFYQIEKNHFSVQEVQKGIEDEEFVEIKNPTILPQSKTIVSSGVNALLYQWKMAQESE